MDILINGESGLVETDNDVTIAQLHEYLTQELAKQGMILRTFSLDGTLIYFDVEDETHAKSPSEFEKCEIECDGAEQVTWEILTELEDKPKLLSEEAATITEELQTGKTEEANQRLVRFSNSVSYIINGISGANGVVGFDFAEALNEEDQERLGKIGEYLSEIDKAIQDQDFTTVGDILEFDLAPALAVLTTIIGLLKEQLAKRAEFSEGNADES